RSPGETSPPPTKHQPTAGPANRNYQDSCPRRTPSASKTHSTSLPQLPSAPTTARTCSNPAQLWVGRRGGGGGGLAMWSNETWSAEGSPGQEPGKSVIDLRLLRQGGDLERRRHRR